MDRIDNIIKLLLFLIPLILSGCSPKPYTLGAIKTFDPDTTRIPQPNEAEQLQYWDRIDNTIFHQLEKPLDLNRVGRFIGKSIGVAEGRQADNINHLDEPVESSWYTYRHFYDPMSIEELKRGPNTTSGPDTSGTWTIFQAKLEGATSGFFIKDARGDRYLIKFDGYRYPELTTSADAISTRIFYASGYTVPESAITYFDPEKVVVGEGVKVEEKGKKREMTRRDYLKIIEGRPQNEKGNVRALASKFVDGIPLGPWGFEGTRKDDPNDRVKHEHRREIRGMRVVSSWVNDTDRRDANTMAVYNDQGYIEHYVQDFGNTLGANGSGIHMPIYGKAYLIDPRFMALSSLGLGFYVTSWETVEPDPPYPSVGYFEAENFKPGGWVPAHPIPAFENMTLRDAYWGAKMVMSFTEEEIKAIVETGELSNPEAADYIVDVLLERQEMIGRYWFSRMNPLDHFELDYSKGERLVLNFTDLGVESDLYKADKITYRYSIYRNDDVLKERNETPDTNIDLSELVSGNRLSEKDEVIEVKIVSDREELNIRKSVTVFIHIDQSNDIARIAGIDREE